MLRYALTIFLSAFLLFQVQPLISKFILPWFGGTPGVWTTAMLFFQVVLLAGYAYAHLVATRLSPRRQMIVHLIVLAAAVALLPIVPSDRWKPASEGNPTLQILLLLTACVGLPYFVLATTSPLMQAWFHRTHPGRSPYRLYALSNVGSLLALLSFPFVFEPWLQLRLQGWLWSLAFALVAVLAGYCALRAYKASGQPEMLPAEIPSPNSEIRAEEGEERPGWGRRAMWLVLPACGSVMFLAVTNQMCLDVAVVPFFWVLPLSLYLLSFIICFDNERWYFRPVWWAWMAGGVLVMLWLMHKGVDADLSIREILTWLGLGGLLGKKVEPAVIWTQIIGYSLGLFGCLMVCHGELVRLKPSPKHLTSFYLMVSAGGALGGVFVSLIAPYVFKTYLEFHIGLFASCALAVVAFWMHKKPHRVGPVPWYGALGVVAYFLVAAAVLMFAPFPWLRWRGEPMRAADLLSLWALAGILVTCIWLIVDLGKKRRWWWLGAAGYFLLLGAALHFAPLKPASSDEPLSENWTWLRPEHILGVWAFFGAVVLAIWQRGWFYLVSLPTLLAALTYVGLDLWGQAAEALTSSRALSRNFYGVLKVGEYYADDPQRHQLILSHGRINHGAQLCSEEGRRRAITYFGEESGIGIALLHHPRRAEGLRVGVLGLGTGTIAAYGRRGDVYRFYEINPRVIEYSGRKGVDASDPIFTYLTDTEADCRTILGDGRLSLERQPSQQFDILAMDAFSSDAVPVHLLTAEAFDIYRKHIKPDGIIAVNVTNRFVDLRPVVRAQAERLGMKAKLIIGKSDYSREIYYTSWMLVTANEDFLQHPAVAAHDTEPEEEGEKPEGRRILWTDDYSNLFRILK